MTAFSSLAVDLILVSHGICMKLGGICMVPAAFGFVYWPSRWSVLSRRLRGVQISAWVLTANNSIYETLAAFGFVHGPPQRSIVPIHGPLRQSIVPAAKND